MSESRLQVPADVSIRNAESFKATLLEGISEGSAVTLDLSEVESIDMSFFQIVWAGQLLAERMGKRLSLDQQSASAPVREAVTLSGFSRHAGCAIEDESVCLWMEED